MKFIVLLFLVALALAKDGDDRDDGAPYVHTVGKHGVPSKLVDSRIKSSFLQC